MLYNIISCSFRGGRWQTAEVDGVLARQCGHGAEGSISSSWRLSQGHHADLPSCHRGTGGTVDTWVPSQQQSNCLSSNWLIRFVPN